jgi:hypothetical protein
VRFIVHRDGAGGTQPCDNAVPQQVRFTDQSTKESWYVERYVIEVHTLIGMLMLADIYASTLELTKDPSYDLPIMRLRDLPC